MSRLHRRLFFLAGLLLAAAGEVTAQTDQPLTKFDSAADWESFPKLFKPFNARPGRSVTHGRDGLTFTLVPRKEKGPVGMLAGATLTGDFQVEVKYDLQVFPGEVSEGYGVYLGISAVAADGGAGRASVTRGVYANAGHQYAAGRDVPGPRGVVYARSRAPAPSRRGRLALRRLGGEAVALVADDPAGELLEIKRYPFTDRPVRNFTLFADTGGAAVELRARLFDLQVRTGADVPTTAKPGPAAMTVVPLPGEAPPGAGAGHAEPSPGPLPQISHGQANWRVGGVGFLMGLVLGLTLGIGVGRWWGTTADRQAMNQRGGHAGRCG